MKNKFPLRIAYSGLVDRSVGGDPMTQVSTVRNWFRTSLRMARAICIYRIHVSFAESVGHTTSSDCAKLVFAVSAKWH